MFLYVVTLFLLRFVSFLFVSFISAGLLAPYFVGVSFPLLSYCTDQFRKVTKACSKYIFDYSFHFVYLRYRLGRTKASV